MAICGAVGGGASSPLCGPSLLRAPDHHRRPLPNHLQTTVSFPTLCSLTLLPPSCSLSLKDIPHILDKKVYALPTP